MNIKNYWKAANDYGRVNSRAYRDVVIALQEEFSLDENIALVHDFMHHLALMKTRPIRLPSMITSLNWPRNIAIFIAI